MGNDVVFGVGVTLLILAAVGYFYPVNDRGYTAIQLDEFCSTGLSQLALFAGNKDVVQVCQQMKMITFGIYGAGVIGIILIIVGAVVSGERKESKHIGEVKETDKEDDSLEILNKRYAKGEISKEEFEQMKKDLATKE